MEQFFYICLFAAALTGAVFFGYPLGFWLGNRNGFNLGERFGRAEAGAEQHRVNTELAKAATEYIRTISRNDVLDANTLEDSK